MLDIRFAVSLLMEGESHLMNLRLLLSTKNSLLSAGILLLLLAIVDSIFTDIGIRNDFITEANPLMQSAYETSISGFYIIKIGFPFLLLYILTRIEPKSYLRLLMGFTVLLYCFVLSLHIYWIAVVSVL